MLHKARLLIALSGTLFLAACVDGPTKNLSMEAKSVEITDVQEDANEEDTEEIVTTSETEKAEETEEAEADEIVGGTESVDETAELETAENALTVEELDTNYSVAIKQIIEKSNLDAESFSFIIEETEEHVEITVYEKTKDQAHSPQQGRYRYIFDSGEILKQDYLTGAFIPFEELEE